MKKFLCLVCACMLIFSVGFFMTACGDGGDTVEREWVYSPCGNFALSILVGETTLPRGENFVVDVRLKNMMEKDVEIGYTWPYTRPVIEGWTFPPQHPVGSPFLFYTIEAGGYLQRTYQIGGYELHNFASENAEKWVLALGAHDLKFHTQFTICADSNNPPQGTPSNWLDMEWISFYSNIIKITVN